DVSHAALLADFDTTFGSAYSVSFFTRWAPGLVGQVWMKRRGDTDGEWLEPGILDGTLADGKRHPLPGHDAVHCTEQGGLAGPWHERLPHFRLDFTPSSGDELQTEYLVPRDRAVAILRDLEALAPRIHPLLHVSEIRTMCADDLWLSGAYGRNTVGIHFTWQRRSEVLGLLPDLDAFFAGRGGRPHWGKLYDASPASITARYPRFAEFAALAERMDPTGKFRNRTLDALLGTG
ncbi:MAG: FAD-binding protein, partial [Actinobacteria bacterium]|nr:FAD-binding protein [Actinomycetota bacterium]